MLLCYITDRTQFPGGEAARRGRLLEKIAEAARCGVDFIQLREKDLCVRDLEKLARDAVSAVEKRRGKTRTRVLINSRVDVAIAAGADGVHLRSDDISPPEARRIWDGHRAGFGAAPVIMVSCHSVSDVTRAAAGGADFAIFAPVFEKRDSPGQPPAGLEALRQACRNKLTVLALGGVTLANADSCVRAGAAGIAGIRLFQENEISEVAGRLRQL